MGGTELSAREVKYVAFDPGETTGFAQFDPSGDLIRSGKISVAGKPERLYQELPLAIPGTTRVVIIEDYELFAHKAAAQSWSKLETVRYIGAIQYHAHLLKAEVVFQKPNVKPVAYMWAGIEVPKQKIMTHETDAFVHGVYYLQKSGIRKPQQGRA